MPRRMIPDNLQAWIDTRKRFHLSHAQVQMARELGMNPQKLGGKANHRQEPWKMPLPDYIEHLYEKRFGKPRPDRILSIEDLFKLDQQKRAERTERKRQKRLENGAPQMERQAPGDGIEALFRETQSLPQPKTLSDVDIDAEVAAYRSERS